VIAGALAGLLAADELRGLVAVAAQLRATGGDASGTAIGARVGRGHDLHGLDPFRPGDDPRAIDWRARQRTGALWVRRHHVEGERAIAVLIDDSASMTRARRQLARRIAAGLAVVAGGGGAAGRGGRPRRCGDARAAAGAPGPRRGRRAAGAAGRGRRAEPGQVAPSRAAPRRARCRPRARRAVGAGRRSDRAGVGPRRSGPGRGAGRRRGAARAAGRAGRHRAADRRARWRAAADVDRLRSAERGATRAIDHVLARGFAARVAAWHRELAGAFARVGAPLVVIDVAAPPPLAALVAQVVAAWR
jgi:hypothetical protein